MACGSGRHAVWLAGLGLRVEAVDRDAAALAVVAREATLLGLDIRTRCVDLEGDTTGAAADEGAGSVPALTPGAHDLVVVFNYLHRPLFPHLLASVRPGGLLIYETFTAAQARLGRPTNPAFLLEPGELRERTRAFDILDAREGVVDGRAIASVVCRRPLD